MTKRNNNPQEPVFLVRVVTTEDVIIEKEVSSDNEYHALLDFVEELKDDFNLYYPHNYVVTAVVQVEK